METKETVQYQRSVIPDFDAGMDMAKDDITKCYVDKGDILRPGCA